MDTPSLEELTRRWVAAWAVARSSAVETVDGWPLVRVGVGGGVGVAAASLRELVCAEPAIARWPRLLGRIAGDPTAKLTVVTRQAAAYVDELPAGVQVDRDDEILMWRSLGVLAPVPPEVGLSAYDVQHELDGDRLTVRLLADERVVTEGTVAVVRGIVGVDAAYDRVETLGSHRRRGLGSWVMAELDHWVVGRGAGTGLLLATPDGAALYGTLGWRVVAPVYSLVGSDSTSTNTSSALGSATM